MNALPIRDKELFSERGEELQERDGKENGKEKKVQIIIRGERA